MFLEKMILCLLSFKYKLNLVSLLNIIYNSFILHFLEHGDVVWDNCTQEQSYLLESVPPEAARIVTGLRRTSSTQHF